ncbi:DNA mismatch repair protein MutL [Jaminaea rosea]|uniref:DNA mismatch repair protein MutL n=1 Tax=Jaminaea rosea TaxID=1569628 RepID=A0A316USI5_9BASI|nr:DNA mismatch repair protein MutL [Jaminaea rosea]PWN27954.1 DNA mismatch repair protein MutL [Jaminaea rosea]
MGGDDGSGEDVVTHPARPILRLDEAVVNRIAAGEIIHRPANALKELIENSLDAGATLIHITLKEGGLKWLQIRDNGSGIRPGDLPLLCERFATSKLRDFDDLSAMTTFGFRGEALASISFVSASMSVVTKTKQDPLAYKAFYTSGALAPPKPGQSSEPKPCAGSDGTILTAEDLFYNVPQRRRALKSAAEEYNRALDIAAKYALHYGSRGVGFVCKKSGSNATDLSTPSSSATQTMDTIRLLHGTSVARELVHLEPKRNAPLGFTVAGYISGANWSAKRTTFLCFINHRLVDCSALKRSFETLYSAMLPKGGHPWIYLSLEIDPAKVDVNVHPTKREVHFLNEDEIVETVCTYAQDALAGANSTRTFQFTQSILPGATQPGASSTSAQAGPSGAASMRPPAATSQNPQYQVRVDAKTRTLPSMFSQNPNVRQDATSSDPIRVDGEAGDEGNETTVATTSSARFRVDESPCTLSSVLSLRSAIHKQRHGALTDILQNHTFVGVVDLDRGLSLFQHGTKLYLANHDDFIEEAAYQLCLRQFGSVKRTRLDPPLGLEELVRLGVEIEAPRGEGELEELTGGMGRAELVRKITDHLAERGEMLGEYFSLDVRSSGDGEEVAGATIHAIPCLIPGQSDALPAENLPSLLVRLALNVDWDDEQGCFDGFARELGAAHRLGPLALVAGAQHNGAEEASATAMASAEDRVAHLWFPYFAAKRGGFLPPKQLVKPPVVRGAEQQPPAALVQLASLNELYRIFERC